jgi:hypothetical protein
MRGTWKKLKGQQLFLPPNVWIALYVGPYTICNLGGQMLKVVTKGNVDEQFASLGPDAMDEPFPGNEIAERLLGQRLPIAEALLNQSVLAGIGNIAKSEILFSAGIDPRAKVSELSDGEMPKLLKAIEETLWRSYNQGGSSRHLGKPENGGGRCTDAFILVLRQPPIDGSGGRLKWRSLSVLYWPKYSAAVTVSRWRCDTPEGLTQAQS